MTKEEAIDKAFDDGYEAAKQGLPQSFSGAMCMAWLKGWAAYHNEQSKTNKG